MKKVFIILGLIATQASGQVLQNINYNYLYNPDSRFTFQIRQVRYTNDSSLITYSLQLLDTLQKPEDYTIRWEHFESLLQKEGREILPSGKTLTLRHLQQGSFLISNSLRILAAKVTSISQKQAWFFFKAFSSALPVGYFSSDKRILTGNYATLNQPLRIHPTPGSAFAFYYREDFPAASPPFTESQTSVKNSLKPDSTFQIKDEFAFSQKGLYLLQTDTSSAAGIAIRVEADYPRYSKLESLADPVIYITTKTELDRLRSARGDKRAFDKVILSIVGNTERARLFMRNYFRRVELANRFFTSYKEGWKTDRGMLYIIFGQPGFVYKFTDREVWEYKTVDGKVSFTFVHSPTLFDPDNYVLIRKKSYRDVWLQAVDLNRNARF
jgi:GWxTD domain-containing protein